MMREKLCPVLLVDIAVRVPEIMIVIITIGLFVDFSGDCLEWPSGNSFTIENVFERNDLFLRNRERKSSKVFQIALLTPSIPKLKSLTVKK